MTKLKLYLRTRGNIEEQSNAYIEAFKGKLLKKLFLKPELEVDGNEKTWTYSYLELMNDINIMIARHNDTYPATGYSGDFILRLENETQFDEIQRNLENSKYFKEDYPKTKYEYAEGIYLTKFYDQWGNGWILETHA
ncbi:hypothetical protein [Candidatus Mycoplasma mahonii]|uniref:hypothetical protein n=1 Tax=Candidatus Mycoplasma mahonii TaxID=3004105 RepID=UPI0026EF56E0|nr:hypothetical protein [Candidatus Mycoplasma mahonii]WKX02442.1 hypothetical protein O3I44_03565 [Candidatus Mycoplasma mahonii]